MANARHDDNSIASLLVQNPAGTQAIAVTGAVLTNSNPMHVAVVDINGSIATPGARATTATLSNVNDGATSVTILAANSNRLGVTIFNDSSSDLYLKFGITAGTTDFSYKLSALDTLEVPFGYTGRIDGLWSADTSTGAARVTEYT